jgi:tetratricopeptide (TPR) repeat protein
MTEQATAKPTRRRLSAEETYAAATMLHERGRLREAEQLYRALLHTGGPHAGALHRLGILCTQTGRPDEAVKLIEQSIAIDPGSAQARIDLGVALTAMQRPEQALAQHVAAAALDPANIAAHNNAGTVLLGLGRPHEAIAHFERALAVKPDTPELHNNLGNALAGLNRHDEAIACYRRAAAINPNFVLAINNCGIALAGLGRDEEAVASFEAAIATTPAYADARANLARCLARLRRHDAAIGHFQAALAIRPDDAELYNSLGNTLQALGRVAEARVQYLKALALRPSFAEVHNNLGNALAALNLHEEAVGHFRKALALAPRLIEANNNLGASLEAIDQIEPALACYEAVIAADPGNARARHRIGHALRTLGRLDESQRAFESAVALAPDKPEFLRSLAEGKTFQPGDPHLAMLEGLARNIDRLSEHDRIELHFALAKAYGDLGRHADAFRHMLDGNALRRRQIAYDEPGTLALFERIRSVFTPELLRRHAGGGDPSMQPVFVFGMPRSGSTLVEQMLASHPQVFAAGEITELLKAVAAMSGRASFPEGFASADAAVLRDLGAGYVGRIARLAAGAARVTDKALANFLYAGLIHLALPNARMIHTQRDPLDTCFSAFSKLFTTAQPHTFDLGELGRYYRAYDGLMAHWREVLPDGCMLEVRYEDLVADFAPQGRRIVAHCGLAWDDACLAFHAAPRPVRTASAIQVRQPIYGGAVGRWRPYAEMLGPLLAALETPAP